MPAILVSGLINIETTLRVDGFPIHYTPVLYPFYGVNTTVSGVGFNIAKALSKLGNKVQFLSIIGNDPAGHQIRSELAVHHIQDTFIFNHSAQTAQSIILYDQAGRRQIHVDLKDLQEQVYPLEIFDQAVKGCEVVSLCNINFSRPMLKRAHLAGKLIATDVHTINTIDDDYNRDFMRSANILFMSDEALPTSPENFAKQVIQAYGTGILVIGLGSQGALLAVQEDHFLERIPPVYTRPVVNTIGAGDALFSAFLHHYVRSHDPYESIRKAMIFASYKIGEKGAAEGFLTDVELESIAKNMAI